MEKKYKKTKKLYSRKYRKENPEKVKEYNTKHMKDISSRVQARRDMKKKMGAKAIEGKDIHHVDGNPKNNSKKNLKIAKRHHEGGAPGNKNRKKKR